MLSEEEERRRDRRTMWDTVAHTVCKTVYNPSCKVLVHSTKKKALSDLEYYQLLG